MGETVAIFIDEGYEERELIYPYYRLLEAGYAVEIVADASGIYRGKQGYPFAAPTDFELCLKRRYRALYIPGGHAPERLRRNPRCLHAVRTLAAGGSLLCAVCHGPLVFAAAGLLRGRHVTGYRTIRPELARAGASVTGSPVECDGAVITAENPAALPEMMRLLLRVLRTAE